MYDVLLDDRTLHVPGLDEYELIEPKVDIGVNRAGTFTFTIYPNHPEYNNIIKLKSVIEVYQRGVLIFRGRPLTDNTDFYMAKKVHCEGDLAFLNDTIVRPYEHTGSVKMYLQMLLDNHNKQTESEKHFKVGNITVTNSTDNIVRADSEYRTTWEIINQKLIGYMGGYLMVRRTNGVNYIDYLEDSTYKSDQAITLGTNLLDVERDVDGDQIVTAMIPTGATLDNEEDPEAEPEVVDITSVNNGLDYIYNKEAVERYGWVFKHVEYENITLPENLLKQAKKDLAKMAYFKETITATALDLNLLQEEFHRFRLFEYVEIRSPEHELSDFYLITNQTFNLNNPNDNTITIGAERDSLSNAQVNLSEEITVLKEESKKVDQVIKQNNTVIMHKVTEEMDRYNREIEKVITDTSNNLSIEMNTIMEQTSEGFQLSFNKVIEQFQLVDGEMKEAFNIFNAYIRFEDGDIILGRLGNPIILRLKNDRIQFLENNVEVAYFTDNKLFVKDGEFLESVTIGKFAFYPLSNGNTTFRKIR